MGELDSGKALVRVESADHVTTVTLTNSRRRNSLSFEMLAQLGQALDQIARTDAAAVVIAAEGPVFSSGHDFADLAERDYDETRELLELCARVMTGIAEMPQVVVAKVHALATAGGCQLVASCDLAVAAESAGFALPGGKAGWFCHTPSVPVARSIGRKRMMEFALSGDLIDASTAAEWGLINHAVPDDELDEAVDALAARVTRGSRSSKTIGKQTLRRQMELSEPEAYRLATEVMAATSQRAAAREGIDAFLEKRPPIWTD